MTKAIHPKPAPPTQADRARQMRADDPTLSSREIARRLGMTPGGAWAALKHTPKPPRVYLRSAQARRLRTMYPDMSVAEIAKRVGMTAGGAHASLRGYKSTSGGGPRRVLVDTIRNPRRVPRRHLTLVPNPNPELQHTRGDCEGGHRPCPLVSCRHHLAVDEFGAGTLHVFEIGTPSCSLDVADDGAHTLEEVAAVLGVTRERVRQIESIALRSLRARGGPSTKALAAHHADPAERRHNWERF
jgi:hypothetical protein